MILRPAKRYHFKLSKPIKDLVRGGPDALAIRTRRERELIYKERGQDLLSAFEGIVETPERRYMETIARPWGGVRASTCQHPCPTAGAIDLKKKLLQGDRVRIDVASFMISPSLMPWIFLDLKSPAWTVNLPCYTKGDESREIRWKSLRRIVGLNT